MYPPSVKRALHLCKTGKKDHRLVVILHDIQGFSYKEIGEVLNISLGTVKSRLNRARLKLAEILAPLREQLRR
ncbi:MAG: sigma factor-like helix-turn-helix DNA-binding protein [Actinomycetota bacterium]|nr:sigma factor-like helix-turn-helix DNA-binding protein [Actinomycetota bacterium]